MRRKQSKEKSINEIKTENNTTRDPIPIAKAFRNYYEHVFTLTNFPGLDLKFQKELEEN